MTLLLTGKEFFKELHCRVVTSGVMTLPKPTSEAVITQTLRALCAMRERLRRRENQTTVEEKIRELRIINQAKCHLIEQNHLTEPKAHHAIEQLDMERRITHLRAAELLLSKQ